MLRLYVWVAIGLLFGACQSKPSESELMGKAREKMKTNAFAEATSLLDEVLKTSPQNADALNMRGVAFFNLLQHSQALSDFDAAIQVKDNDYRFYYNRGNVKRQLNQPEAAYKDYTQALALDSTQYEIWLNRSLAQRATDNWEGTLHDLNQALAKGGENDYLVHFHLGKAYFQAEQFVQSVAAFKRIHTLKPDMGEAYYLCALAQLAGELGKEEACANAKIAVEKGYADAKDFISQYCK